MLWPRYTNLHNTTTRSSSEPPKIARRNRILTLADPSSSLTIHLDYSTLRYAGVGNVGVKALAVGLVLNTVIHTINLAGNGIGPRGGKALGKGLAGNESVVNLLLDSNDLGNEGVCALLKGLEKNSTLEV